MLLVTFDQPFSAAEFLKSCSVDTQQERYLKADLLPGMTFRRGDYLFCVKDSQDQSCAATDYQWLDTASKTLVNTRPTSPRQHSFLLKESMTCSDQGEGRVSIEVPYMPYVAKILGDRQFKIYADFSHAEMSRQWKDASHPKGEEPADKSEDESAGISPYLIYYYQENGVEKVGTKLKIDLNFAATDIVFIEGIEEGQLDDKTIGDILSHTWLKTEWAFAKKAESGVIGWSINHVAAFNVTPTITLEGETNPPTDDQLAKAKSIEAE